MSDKYIELQHDGFGRRTLLRRIAPNNFMSCAWCGQRARFQYTWVRDDQLGPITELQWDSRHAYCSISCWRTYTWQ